MIICKTAFVYINQKYLISFILIIYITNNSNVIIVNYFSPYNLLNTLYSLTDCVAKNPFFAFAQGLKVT